MKKWKVILGMTTTFLTGVMVAVGYLNDGLELKK